MKITGVFVSISIAIVLFSSLATIEAGPAKTPCSKDDQCPSSLTCAGGYCTDICWMYENESRTCKMANWRVKITCKPGFDFVKGDSSGTMCFRKTSNCLYEQRGEEHFYVCDDGEQRCASFGICVWWSNEDLALLKPDENHNEE